MLSTMLTGTGAVDITTVLEQIKTLVPIVLPCIIGFLAFRKGWGFIHSAIKGA